jgi:hypothetical protein
VKLLLLQSFANRVIDSGILGRLSQQLKLPFSSFGLAHSGSLLGRQRGLLLGISLDNSGWRDVLF